MNDSTQRYLARRAPETRQEEIIFTRLHGGAIMDELTVRADATLLEALAVIDRGAKAIALVCDGQARVIGTVTDGDVRRALLGGAAIGSRCLPDIIQRNFVWVPAEAGRAEVLDLMRARLIEQIPVLDERGRLCGMHTLQTLIAPTPRQNTTVILAGGQGVRLRPLTQELPKPMLPVAGRPILERLILHLMGCGLFRFYLAVHYMADVIEGYFGDGSRFGCSIEYLREEQPLGTGGALSLLPQGELPVLVMNGDLVTQLDADALLSYHDRHGFWATFGVRPYSVEIPFGVARVVEGRLVDLQEKPTEQMLINAGAYVLSPQALQLVPRGRPFPITDLFAQLLQDGHAVGAHLIEEEWADIGRHEELRRARGHV
jgi:dTDP-glucose pyrophosphorylase/CBS domain-containing protein